MRVLSLFSGLGGFDLAARWVGWQTTAYIEIEPWACKTMAHHFPDAPNLGDVTLIDWSHVERPDIVVGGFPCQPASTAGRRRGTGDERWLWPEVARCLGALRPRWALLENVPGLLSVNGGAAFGEVLGDLARLGYDASWFRVAAADVGAPHKRERVWIVAHLSDAAGPRLEEAIGPQHEGRGERLAEHVGELGHALGAGLERLAGDGRGSDEPGRIAAEAGRSTRTPGQPIRRPWSDAIAVRGADGTVRLVPGDAVADASGLQRRAAPTGGAGDAGRTAAAGRGEGMGDAGHSPRRTESGASNPSGESREPGCRSGDDGHRKSGAGVDGLSGGLQSQIRFVADGPAGGLAGRAGVPWTTPQAHDATPRGSGNRMSGGGGGFRAGDLAHETTDFAPEAEGWMTSWPVVSGMPNRAAGCRLVGNAIVPWIPLAIFRAIERVEGDSR